MTRLVEEEHENDRYNLHSYRDEEDKDDVSCLKMDIESIPYN